MQYSKENTLDDVLVEGNVTKVEEKSKLWIYLKNASINKKAAGEGVIVQIPVSAHSNQKRPLAGSKISVYGKLSLFSKIVDKNDDKNGFDEMHVLQIH